jgi:hypothetical protein
MQKQALACVKLLLENGAPFGALVDDTYTPLDPSQAYFMSSV